MQRIYAEKPNVVIESAQKEIMGQRKLESQPSYFEWDEPRKIKKIRRPKPRNKFIKEVMRYQREINFLIPKAPFRRVVREIAEKINPTIKFNERALQALQEASEAFIVGTMEDGVLCTIHASRVTLMKKDVELAKRIKGDPS